MLPASKLSVPDAAIPADLRELPANGSGLHRILLGAGYSPVDHAAPDSRALLVEADGQRLLYSGDLRAHGRQRQLFEELPEAAGPIDVLVLEGTTVGQTQGSHGFPDETDVEIRLTELLRHDGGLIVVIASGQNIDRAVSVYRAAVASGRELVIDAYQAYVLMTLRDVCPEAPQFDSPSVRVKFIPYRVARLKDAGFWNLACKMSRAGKVSLEQLAANPSGFVYLTRSSGATVKLLHSLARTRRPTIVWSQWSGYLKKGGPVPRFCEELGIKPKIIHSGGHAHPTDLGDLAHRLHASAVVPIHTEAAPQFGDFIQNVQVVNDGEAVEVASLIFGYEGVST